MENVEEAFMGTFFKKLLRMYELLEEIEELDSSFRAAERKARARASALSASEPRTARRRSLGDKIFLKTI